MPDARSAILGRLRSAPQTVAPEPDFSVMDDVPWAPAERLPRLRRMMEATHTEFVDSTAESWPHDLLTVLREAGARNLLIGTGGPVVEALRSAWAGRDDALPLIPFDSPLEARKAQTFSDVDAGFTSTLGGIADTGSLILWPGAEEPRSLSLIPPLHVALLNASQISDTLWHAMRTRPWAAAMPTNALLVSGPSKTADIEQTLAYGVHGPKRLIVIVYGQDRLKADETPSP